MATLATSFEAWKTQALADGSLSDAFSAWKAGVKHAGEAPMPSGGFQPRTMRAVYSEAPTQVGGTVPLIDTAPAPSLANGQPYPGFVVVRNLAASFNPVDKYIAAGYFAQRSPIFKMPRSVGSDFAGIVVAVGDGATVASIDETGTVTSRPAHIGDAVFGDGIAGTGTFAEYVSVLSEQVCLKPRGLSFAEAAALPLAGLTAYQAFTEHATTSVGPGSKVLILGGTGGVGSMGKCIVVCTV